MRRNRNAPVSTLGVLRGIIGLEQSELGKLTGYSRAAIQKVEQGRGPLTSNFALVVSQKTGISISWLMGGDLKNPVSATGQPYTREVFDLAGGRRKMKRLDQRTTDGYVNTLVLLLENLARIVLASYKNGDTDLAVFQLGTSINEIGKQYPGCYQWLSEIQSARVKAEPQNGPVDNAALVIDRLARELHNTRGAHLMAEIAAMGFDPDKLPAESDATPAVGPNSQKRKA